MCKHSDLQKFKNTKKAIPVQKKTVVVSQIRHNAHALDIRLECANNDPCMLTQMKINYTNTQFPAVVKTRGIVYYFCQNGISKPKLYSNLQSNESIVCQIASL